MPLKTRGVRSDWLNVVGPNVIYLRILQGVGLCMIPFALLVVQPSPWWWLLTGGVYFATACLGVAVTYHRALAHRGFVMARPVAYLFTAFGAIGGSGSSVAWVAVHRKHHSHADREDDPHAPGFVGWKLLVSGFKRNYDWWRVRDLLRDPFHRFLHQHYAVIVLVWAGLLLAIDPLALIFGFLIPAALQITVINLSTILGHGHGYRNFDTRDRSTNNALVAVLTWGDGWHNNHHARPRHWSTRVRWWELDIPALCVRGLAVLGLVRLEKPHPGPRETVKRVGLFHDPAIGRRRR